MIILVDVDGVVLDLNTEWLYRHNCDYHMNVKNEDIKSWDISKYVHPDCGQKIYDYLNDPDLYQCVQPIDGAIEGVKELRSLGNRLIFTTAYFNTQKIKRLNDFGFLVEFPYNDGRWQTANDAVMINDKNLLKGVCNFIIDDRTENVENFGNGWIFTQPWNEESNLPRVSGWEEIIYKAKNEMWQA